MARFQGEFRWVVTLAAITLFATTTAFITGALVGVPTLDVYAGYLGGIWDLVPPVIFLSALGYIIICAARRVEHPLQTIRPRFADRFGTPDRAAGTVGPILLMPLMLGAFGTLKQVLPLVNPFGWDADLAKVGPFLFGGLHTWQITHYFFGSPLATLVLDRVYTSWILILFLSVVCIALFAEPRLRARFFLAFAASWLLLGVATAFLFSSAGPCFADRVGSSADFSPLMARLHAINDSGYHLYALEWQDILWKAGASHHYGFAMGVSAMPSMHNAISFLYVLAASRSRPLVRVATWLFAVTILIASIHLGWHYLVDGLMGWAGMTLIWWGAEAVLRWSGYQAAPSLRLVSATAEPESEERPRLLTA